MHPDWGAVATDSMVQMVEECAEGTFDP